ncbi:MAG: NADH-quinone oxidoreductase subunit K [Bacteroidales bacterium]
MEIVVAILVGVLYTAGAYLLLRRSILKFIVGILFLSNATNLLVFISAGVEAGAPAFIDKTDAGRVMSDPLPQALVLTAVVIGLGVAAYTLALKYKYYEQTGTDDLDELKSKTKE